MHGTRSALPASASHDELLDAQFSPISAEVIMLRRVCITAARILVSTLAICGCLSRPATAQTSRSSAGPTSAVRVGQTVWVTTADGREVEGIIGSVSGSEIGVQTGQQVTSFRWTEVRLIQAPDSIVDGVVKGAIYGGLAGAIPAAVFMGSYGECPCSTSGGIVMGYTALGAGIGAVIGAAVDGNRIGRRQLYKASPTVALAPLLLPGRVAVTAAVRW